MVEEIIDELPSMTEAIRFAIRKSGLTDKQVYIELGIDSSQWAKIMKGLGYFPHEKFIELMSICDNDIPLKWLASKRGYDLKIRKNVLEEQLADVKAENAELKKKLEWFQTLRVVKDEKDSA
jgi:hypothetical protein